MTVSGRAAAAVVAFAFVTSGSAAAQQRTGWSTQVDGLAVFQGSAGLSGGGNFTANRAFLRAGGIYNFDNGVSVGLSGSIGRFNYDFHLPGNQPWDEITDLRVSVPVMFPVGETARVLLSPSVRWDYQRGARSDDGRTYGVFAGIAWEVSDNLTIGPAFGAFTQIEDGDLDVFPALLLDWDINDRFNLSTGTGLGATQGPGLSLGYAVNDSLRLSLSARSEKVRFRLDGAGLAPGGVGQDQSIPVVLSLNYEANPGLALSVFAGAEFNGELSLETASGAEVSRQSYETAPIAGFAFRVRF